MDDENPRASKFRFFPAFYSLRNDLNLRHKIEKVCKEKVNREIAEKMRKNMVAKRAQEKGCDMLPIE